MYQKRENGIRFANIREEASAILSQNANRLKLMEAIMVSVTPLMLYLTLISTYQVILLPSYDWQSDILRVLLCEAAFWGALCGLTFFFTLPLLSGLLFMACGMEAGEEVLLSDVFHAFSNGKAYRESLKMSWSSFWRLLLLFVAECAVYEAFAAAGIRNGALTVLSVFCMILVFAVWYFLVGLRGFMSAYLALESRELRERMRRCSFGTGLRFWNGWFPWLLLSLLTFCILLLADVLPRMLISYFRVCRNLKETTEQSEEYNHE